MKRGICITTIKQVAKAAGVSPTTVSHALTGRGRVAEETRDRILKVVADLQYESNRHAQQLVTRRSRILAIQLPFMGHGEAAFPHSGYYLEVMNGASNQADELGYALVVVPAAASGVGNSLAGLAVDGALLVDPEGNEPIFSLPIPLATIGVPVEPTRAVVSVDNDHGATVRKVLQHFQKQGCSRPALVADKTHRSYVDDLVAAFHEHTEERGLSAFVHRSDGLGRAALDQAVRAIQDRASDAVLAISDDIALGLLNAARRLGSPVPQDFLLASAVDAPSLKLTSPQITATNLYPRRTGETAVRLLVDQIESEPADRKPRLEVIPTRLNQRGSSVRALSDTVVDN